MYNMIIKDSYIVLKDVHFYAYHGVLEQEKKVGGEYVLNLRCRVNMAKAIAADKISGTVNYADVYEIVNREMHTHSDLVEHVAGRIGESIFMAYPQITDIEIELIKVNPPMGADCNGAGVQLHLVNNKTWL